MATLPSPSRGGERRERGGKKTLRIPEGHKKGRKKGKKGSRADRGVKRVVASGRYDKLQEKRRGGDVHPSSKRREGGERGAPLTTRLFRPRKRKKRENSDKKKKKTGKVSAYCNPSWRNKGKKKGGRKKPKPPLD